MGRKSRLLSRTKKSIGGQVFVNNRRSVSNVWEIRNVEAYYRIKFLENGAYRLRKYAKFLPRPHPRRCLTTRLGNHKFQILFDSTKSDTYVPPYFVFPSVF